MRLPVTGAEQIGQIAVTVKDLPGAIDFYRTRSDCRSSSKRRPSLAFFDCGGSG